MRLPTPTAREVRATFTLAAVCVLALVATICWGIVHKVNQSDQIVRVATSQADQVERLSHQLDGQNAQIQDLRQQAAKNAQLAARERQSLRSQNHQLLRYLRDLGIAIPPAIAGQRDTGGGGGSTDPKAPATSSGPSPHPHPSTPGSPGSTATPTPTPSPTGGIDLDQVCALLHLYPCPLT